MKFLQLLVVLVLVQSAFDDLLRELESQPDEFERLQRRLLYEDYPGKLDHIVDPEELMEEFYPTETDD